MGPNKANLLLVGRLHHSLAEPGKQLRPISEWPFRLASRGDPGRMLENMGQQIGEIMPLQRVDLAHV